MMRPLLLFALLFAPITYAADKPNIIYILADDLGWTDLACQGSKFYETPNLDRLASQSMRFNCFHVCQNCTPTRAALMSGQYPTRTGVFTVGDLTRGDAADRKLIPPVNSTQLPLDRKTIADQLKAAGYATAMFGKWHIGQQGEYHPSRRGFEQAVVTMGKHFDFNTQPPVDHPKDVYLADWLTDKAIGFIDANKDKPFFLYLPHFAVHSPHVAKPEMTAKFKDKAPAGGHHNAVYAGMIASVDESVGRIMKRLDDLNLSEKTILIFSSDNGGVGGYDYKGVTDNTPLRGGKGQHYEGGLRVPFIVRWPGVIKPATTCDVPAQHVDVFPTLLEITGAPRPPQALDGESLLPLFKDPSAKLKRDAIFTFLPGYLEGGGPSKWRTTPVSSILAGEWKLIEFFEDNRLELYNLKEDLGEKNNLAASNPDKTRELHQRLVAWRKETAAPMPTVKTADTPATPNTPARKRNRKNN